MRTQLRTTAAVAALTLALAGCGSGGGTSVGSASGSTTAAPSTSTTAGGGAALTGTDLSAKMVAAMRDKGTVAAAMTIGGQRLGDMRMDMSSATPKLAMSMSVSGMTLEILMVDNVMYMKGFPEAMTGGKPWVKIDGNGTDAFSKQMRQSMEQGNDPAAMATMMDGAELTKVDETDGITHYAVRMPTASYVKTLPKAQADSIAKTLGDSLDVDYYVDADYLPTKVTMKQAQMAIEYKDWGSAQAIVAPPAGTVGTLPKEILQQMG